jgi:ubiquinone biosynthesis monooxygenase Coq7
MGNAISLGFVEETEKQVSAHLQGHLSDGSHQLPVADHTSRAIVAQMREDEIRHADAASAAGAAELPAVIQSLMRGAAKVMTTVAQRV